MNKGKEAPSFGWSDAELLAYPLVYRPDLFAGKVALVSGGGSGLGKATAWAPRWCCAAAIPRGWPKPNPK